MSKRLSRSNGPCTEQYHKKKHKKQTANAQVKKRHKADTIASLRRTTHQPQAPPFQQDSHASPSRHIAKSLCCLLPRRVPRVFSSHLLGDLSVSPKHHVSNLCRKAGHNFKDPHLLQTKSYFPVALRLSLPPASLKHNVAILISCEKLSKRSLSSPATPLSLPQHDARHQSCEYRFAYSSRATAKKKNDVFYRTQSVCSAMRSQYPRMANELL